MRKKFTILSILCASFSIGFSQTVYKNGYLSTGSLSKSGVVAPTGYTWSEVQNNTGETTASNTNSGFSAYVTTAGGSTTFSLADNFTVPAGQVWAINSISVYGYQTGTTTAPIDALYFRIWNGAPDVTGSTVVFGDLTTNRLSSSTDSLMYRIFNSLYPTASTPGTTRKIWRFTGTGTITLQPGNYWLEWTAHPTNSGTLFFPSSTIVGSRGLAGWNAKQYVGSTATWSAAIDDGNPSTATDYPQDFPFEVSYTNTTPTPVKLLSFTGMQSGQGNTLEWKTTSEIDFSGFDIEKSINGTDFEKVTYLQAKGGSRDNNYTYLDSKVVSNKTYYYRLKQLDKNGTYNYSKIIALKTPELKDDVWVSSFTAKPVITIRAQSDASVVVRISNNNGQVLNQKNLSIKQGITTTELSSITTSSGVYYLTITYSNGYSITKRFVKE